MSANAKHTLLNLEVAPPEGMWESIAARLDTEFDASEIKVSEKIADFAWAPPAGIWDKVSAQLAEASPAAVHPHTTATVRNLWKWMSAAAAVVVLALGVWFFVPEKNTTTPSVTKVQPDPPANNIPPAPSQSDRVPPAVPPVTEPDRPLPRRSPAQSRPRRSYNAMIVSNAGYVPQPAEELFAAVTTNLRAAEPDVIHAEKFTSEPRVIAPPIRDAHGNIILDTHLIFSSDNQYIIVTSPNGEQTRISAKFLPLLGSMNGSAESLKHLHHFLNESNMWKVRFNEWRNKMLSDASFIPAATNFLDLLELKELLQESQ